MTRWALGNDANVFATATTIYGAGSPDAPVQQLDGTLSTSFSTTDLTDDVDPLSGKPLDVAPVTTGWSWQFDGTALNPSLTNIGYERSEFTQTYNQLALWFQSKGAKTRQFGDVSLFHPDVNAQGSYENPIADVTGSLNRSVRVEDWSQSYGAYGKINRDTAPLVTLASSDALADGTRWTRTDSTIVNNAATWAALGRAGNGGH